MRPPSLLEFAALALLALAVTLVASAEERSRTLHASESAAIARLHALAGAQEVFHRRHGRHAFLPELLGIPVGDAPRGAPRALLDDPRGLSGGVQTLRGYHYAVYLVDRDRRPLLLPLDGSSRSDYQDVFLAYAWPVDYGRSGRRVFAWLAPSGLFSFQNATQPYSGPGSRPPAELAASRLDGPDMPLSPPGKVLLQLRWDPVRVRP